MKLFHKPRFLWLFGIFVLWLAIHYWDALLNVLSSFAGAADSLILGCLIAYVANLFMSMIERHFAPKNSNRWIQKLRRPFCLLIAYLSIFALATLLVWMIIPEFVHCIELLTQQLLSFFETVSQKVQAWSTADIPMLDQIQGTLESWVNAILGKTGEGAKWLLDQITGIVSGVSTFVIALAFSIYILAGKEKLKRQFARICRAYLPEKVRKTGNYILSTANGCFRSYIVGQCTEAVILGTLCAFGMLILRLPYAAMVGCVIGVTALIPILGSYIGAGIGAIMIFTISPAQALIFLIFLVILQQLEGNLIYPRVVGQSIGLPGLWVLAAVTVGGGLAGIPGMIFGVPITATVYLLLKNDVRRRTKE